MAAWARAKPGNKPKVKIVPFDKAPVTPDDWEATSWATLERAVSAIHNHEVIANSLNELYSLAESMVKLKMADRLYGRLEARCNEHVRAEGLALLAKIAEPSGFLVAVDRSWAAHCEQVKRIRNIFLVLDQTHANKPLIPGLWDMGLMHYRRHVLAHKDISARVVEGVLELFAAERRGDVVEAGLLQRLLRMLTDLRVYQEMMLEPFLSATTEFFMEEATRLANELDAASYLAHVERRLTQELGRIAHCVDDSATSKRLVGILEEHLISNQYRRLLGGGLEGLLDEGRHTDLGRCFSLLRRVRALGELRTAFIEYIKRRGLALVNDTANEEGLIEALLTLRARMDKCVEFAFGKVADFTSALKEAMTAVVNSRQDRPAELLAKYVDAQLRSNAHRGAAAEENLIALLEAALVLFRYVSGRDVFEAFYKKDLAKRLLLGSSVSFDAEKALILRLKQECGAAFTTKLEGMFRDMELSQELATKYDEELRRPGSAAAVAAASGLEMTTSVLTMGNWPTYPTAAVALPRELDAAQAAFEAFYLSKHTSRRLQWVPTLATCTVRAVFPKAAFAVTLSVSLSQALVLLLFNERDELTHAEIAAATRLEASELERTLLSLSCGKADKRVLLKTPKSKNVATTDTFAYNAAFTSERRHLKINQVQLKETREEAGVTSAKVMQDRQYQIDAAIVRVMKTRSRLTHQALLQEVFQQLKFPVKSADLKKRIESLIDREYLERDAADAAMYVYLA